MKSKVSSYKDAECEALNVLHANQIPYDTSTQILKIFALVPIEEWPDKELGKIIKELCSVINEKADKEELRILSESLFSFLWDIGCDEIRYSCGEALVNAILNYWRYCYPLTRAYMEVDREINDRVLGSKNENYFYTAIKIFKRFSELPIEKWPDSQLFNIIKRFCLDIPDKTEKEKIRVHSRELITYYQKMGQIRMRETYGSSMLYAILMYKDSLKEMKIFYQ